MKERYFFIYIVALAGIALSFLLSGGAMAEWGATDPDVFGVLGYTDADGKPMMLIPFLTAYGQDSLQLAILLLAVIVLVNAALLFDLMKKTVISKIASICAFVITVWAVGPAVLPMAVATALALFGTFGTGEPGSEGDGKVFKRFVAQSVIFYLIWVFLCWAGVMAIISSAFLLGFSLYVFWLLERVRKLEQLAEDSADKTDEIRAMLGSHRRMARSTEHVSRLEERNRLAARIHDEIGHGMSGSILLLEGADLVMDSEPEKARETVRKVAENLRASVEEIRMVLREERSAGAEINLARIENELSAFESDHANIKTKLEIHGNMEDVKSEVWICVHENMVEAMTNMLKHTSATQFLVSLKNTAGLLHVEFSDNGGVVRGSDGLVSRGRTKQGQVMQGGGPVVQPGIGLQNMEERAAMCYGRCFFRHEDDGFHIVMTFPRRD